MTDSMVPRDSTAGPPALPPGTTVCSACGDPVPPGRDRCLRCGKPVWTGEPCPHCGNPVPPVRRGLGCLGTLMYGLGEGSRRLVRTREKQLVCPACGASRGYAVGAAAPATRESRLPPDQAVEHAAQIQAQSGCRSSALKGLAVAFAAGSLGFLLAMLLVFSSGFLKLFGVLGFVAGMTIAAGLFLAGRGLRRRDAEEADEIGKRAIAELARQKNGVVRLDEAAAALQLPPHEVESLLSSFCRMPGMKVDIDASDDGVLVYRFRDWEKKADKELPPAR